VTAQPTWLVLGDSVPGTAHRTDGRPCQDYFRVALDGPADDWLVVAVADGAGSASRAEVGARVACVEVVRAIRSAGPSSFLDEAAARRVVGQARAAVLAEADRLSLPPRELACTLLVAAVGPTAAGFAQIGDGAIVCGSGGEYRAALWPEPGEYANVTEFLTDERYADAARFARRDEPITELAAFTDGLQRLALDFAARRPHPPFLGPLFRQLRDDPDRDTLFARFRDFLLSPAVCARTDDDTTLVLAVRPS